MRDFTNNEALVFIIAVFLIGSLIYALIFKGLLEIFTKKYSYINFIQIFISCIAGEILATVISIIIFKMSPPPSIERGQVGFEESIQQGIDQVSFSLILITGLGVLSSFLYVFRPKTKTNLTTCQLINRLLTKFIDYTNFSKLDFNQIKSQFAVFQFINLFGSLTLLIRTMFSTNLQTSQPLFNGGTDNFADILFPLNCNCCTLYKQMVNLQGSLTLLIRT